MNCPGSPRRTVGVSATSLDAAVGPQLLEGVDVHLAAKVVKSLPVPRAAELLTALDANHAVRILRRFHHDSRDSLLSVMPIEQAKQLREMLVWPTDSVAAYMTTETLALDPATTAEEAVAHIRHRISEQQEGRSHRQLHLCH